MLFLSILALVPLLYVVGLFVIFVQLGDEKAMQFSRLFEHNLVFIFERADSTTNKSIAVAERYVMITSGRIFATVSLFLDNIFVLWLSAFIILFLLATYYNYAEVKAFVQTIGSALSTAYADFVAVVKDPTKLLAWSVFYLMTLFILHVGTAINAAIFKGQKIS